MIDLRLGRDDIGTEIARKLPAGEGPSILCASGNTLQFLLSKDLGEASISMPYSTEDQVRRLEIGAEIGATGIASTNFPRGFRVLSAARAIAARA